MLVRELMAFTSDTFAFDWSIYVIHSLFADSNTLLERRRHAERGSGGGGVRNTHILPTHHIAFTLAPFCLLYQNV